MPLDRKAIAAARTRARVAAINRRSSRPAFHSAESQDRRRERRAEAKSTMRNAANYFGLQKSLPTMMDSLVGKIGQISGLGAYKVRYNSIMKEVDPSQVEADYVPQVANRGGAKSVRIRHREYIQDVFSTAAFANLPFAINPSNINAFPWLSTIARNFQEYRFHGLVFEFISTSADALNSTNTALGTVILSTNYNAADAAYVNKQQAENSEFTVSSRPSRSLIHGVECDPLVTVNQGHLYISPLSNGLAPAGEDVKTYNLGLFQFMTQGSQAAADIGELWVSYDLELMKPINNANNPEAVDHWYMTNISPSSTTGGFMFGSTGRTALTKGVGVTLITSAGDSQIVFPTTVQAGTVYQIVYHSIGGSGTAQSPHDPVLTGCAFFKSWGNSALNSVSTSGSTAADCFYSCFIIVTAVPGNSVIVDFSTVWTMPTGANGDLYITEMPSIFV